MASFSNTSTLPVPTISGGLASRRLTARPLPALVLPSNNHLDPSLDNATDPELITPNIPHFPPVCPPAPAPPTVQQHAQRQLHLPLPTIVLPDLDPQPSTTTSTTASDHHHHTMKAPTSSTTAGLARARVNTVYPPNKRAMSYNAAVPTHHRASNVSPKSMAAAAISKRSSRVQQQPSRTASYESASRRTTPPAAVAPQSRISQQAHQRALAAQRNAALAQRAHTRSSHLSSLDRGIRLLLEEEYREDVKAWMLEKEKATMASASAMDQQPELQWHMRGHLLDFLLEIHLHFRLRPETLYLTLSILDRYVSRRIVYKKHYQLVGCVALWLAAKFEDAKERVPSVKDLKELCHGAYEEGAFVQMEGHVLGTVDWDLGHPTAESWLRVLCTETQLPDAMTYGMFGGAGALSSDGTPFEETKVQYVARFLMEMTLYSREYLQFTPSILALGSLNLARYICGKPRRPADESPAVLHMISLLDHTLSQNLDSVSQTLVKKYSFAHYSKASAVVVGHYLRGHRFPISTTTVSVENPESLTTHTVSVEALRSAVHATRPPVTPVRERMPMQWGSGRTDVEETPGLVRSDSSSSGIGMDLESDLETETEDESYSRSFSEPREFEMVDEEDDEEECVVNGRDEDEDVFSEEEDVMVMQSQSSTTSMLTVPSSDDAESLPITPTTPMFELNPFGSAAHTQVQAAPVVHHQHQHSKDKENVVPHGHHHHHVPQQQHVVHHHQHPCLPNVAAGGVVVESGEDMGGHAEYRQALLAIVP